MKKTKMKGREEKNVRRGDIVFVVVEGVRVFVVEGRSERMFVTV